MRLTEDRISYIAHLLCEGSVKQGLVKTNEMGRLLSATKDVIISYCKIDDTIDDIVRKKLASHTRMILEGSPEWDVMYKKYFQEEMNKHWK
jgi:hypothetical protein